MKKVFAVVISLYLLFLAVIPCHCKEYKIYNIANETQNVFTGQNHYDQVEICSPFCTCAGCIHTQIYYFQLPNVQITEIFLANISCIDSYDTLFGYHNYFCPPPCVYNI